MNQAVVLRIISSIKLMELILYVAIPSMSLVIWISMSINLSLCEFFIFSNSLSS